GSPIRWLRFHPHKQQLAVCIGPKVQVCDLNGRQIIAPLTHPRGVAAVAWSREGRLLATACDDGQAYIWDAADGKQLAGCKGQDGIVQHIAFNQRGDLLASVGVETTQLWDSQTGKELLSADGLATEFSGDDRWLGLGVFGADVGRWEVAIPREYR